MNTIAPSTTLCSEKIKILKTKQFCKWAKKNSLNNETLKSAALEIMEGKVEGNLGHHLFKKRIGINGHGKRGAVRAIVFYQIDNKLIYAHGFMKKDKAALTDIEFNAFKLLANIFLDMTEAQYVVSLKNGDFEEIAT